MVKKIDLHRIKHRLLAVSLIFALLFTSGCSPFNEIITTINNKILGQQKEPISLARKLSQTELVQLLTNALRGDSDLSTIFNSISSKQLDGLSLDEFQQYILLLRQGVSGNIHSFSAMTNIEKAQLLGDNSDLDQEERSLLETSLGYWIIFRQSGKADEKFAIYIQQDQDGNCYLSSQWIRGILQIANYANLYFDALDKADPDALAFLIDQENRSKPVVQAKTQMLIDFYKYNISSSLSEYSLSQARIDSLAYDQFGITNPDLSQSVSRTVSFKSEADGKIVANDIIPAVIDKRDLEILSGGQVLFDMNQMHDGNHQVWSYIFEQQTGRPFKHDDSNCKTYGDGVHLMNLSYNGIAISVQGDCNRHETWNGIIRSAIISRDLYYTGSGLKPGMPLEELLIRYPFVDPDSFRLRMQLDSGTITLRVELEQEEIKRIELSFVPFDF